MQKLVPEGTVQNLIPVDGEAYYYPDFLESGVASEYFSILYKQTKWTRGRLHLFGKTVMAPRLSAWAGDSGITYTYSGWQQTANGWNDPLLEIRNLLCRKLSCRFNSVLLNYYHNGNNSIAWHSDDEKELGRNPVIASISLGGVRRFLIKHRRIKMPSLAISLQHGSLLLMCGEMQQHWQHSLPKTRMRVEPRINLTFRYVSPNRHDVSE